MTGCVRVNLWLPSMAFAVMGTRICLLPCMRIRNTSLRCHSPPPLITPADALSLAIWCTCFSRLRLQYLKSANSPSGT